MRTHKTTRSTMTTSVETGFSRGCEMSVKLASPWQVGRSMSCTDVTITRSSAVAVIADRSANDVPYI